MHRIKCGNGRHVHETVDQVKACHFQTRQTMYRNTRAVVEAPAPAPAPWPFRTPQAMVENMREGRYAVAPYGGSDFAAHTFIKVWRPTKGKRAGQIILSTQHSDAYRELLRIYPSGKIYVSQRGDRIDQSLLMVAADPYTALITYGRLHKVCGKCGKKLTDARSRWYGIGPECEQKWPEVINLVNETRGRFQA